MREELLQKIKSEMSESPDTRTILKANLSTEQLAAKLLSAQAVQKFFAKGLYPVLAVMAVILAIATSISMAHTRNSASDVPLWLGFVATYVLLGGTIFPLTWVAVSSASVAFGGGSHRIEMLMPIAQTDYCERAFKALQEGGLDVVAWRDLAIAQRGQLYGMDVEVMEWLRKVHCRELAAKEKAEKNAEACAMVHQVA